MNKIKRYLAMALAGCLAISAVGCDSENNGETEETEIESRLLALGMAEEYCDSENMIMAAAGDDYFDDYCVAYYGLSDEGSCSIDEGAVIYAYDGLATEIAVIKENENVSTEEIIECINNHIDDRLGVYTGYFPSEEEKLENAVLFASGDYVVFIVSSLVKLSDKKICANKFKEICSCDEEQLSEETEELAQLYADNREDRNDSDETGEETSEDAEEEYSLEITEEEITDESQLSDVDDSTYYNQDIVTAYLTGDASALTDEKDIFILGEVQSIIDENITDDMTDLEKEKAIHDYLCINMDYDEAAVEIEENHMEDSDNPYGMLSAHYGICSGYASTFKLFMDCLEIPCMIVEGKANDFMDDHAWNKVKIDGVWYNVDVTWDDPVYTGTDGKISTWYEEYYYFNCSDQTLTETDHQWNKELYPESSETLEMY